MSSQSDRIKVFYEDASKGFSNKSIKEINTLKKFLYNNQEHTFHEKDKVKLFSTISLFFSYYNKIEENKSQGETEESFKISFFSLIEDVCLKVNIFNFKHKKVFLKWYEDMLGGKAGNSSSIGANKNSKKVDSSKYDYKKQDSDEEEYEDYEEDDENEN